MKNKGKWKNGQQSRDILVLSPTCREKRMTKESAHLGPAYLLSPGKIKGQVLSFDNLVNLYTLNSQFSQVQS